MDSKQVPEKSSELQISMVIRPTEAEKLANLLSRMRLLIFQG
jgi:hypothetical protein